MPLSRHIVTFLGRSTQAMHSTCLRQGLPIESHMLLWLVSDPIGLGQMSLWGPEMSHPAWRAPSISEWQGMGAHTDDRLLNIHHHPPMHLYLQTPPTTWVHRHPEMYTCGPTAHGHETQCGQQTQMHAVWAVVGRWVKKVKGNKRYKLSV